MSKRLGGIKALILITMHSHRSYPDITTVIHSYEYSPTVDNSTIETYRNRGLGIVKCTSILCIISLIVMQGKGIQRLQTQNVVVSPEFLQLQGQYAECVNQQHQQQHIIQPRALSLRNLVSGYERGRVFPAGVGPGSPSRDAVNWLLSRFGLSVETRRQYG